MSLLDQILEAREKKAYIRKAIGTFKGEKVILRLKAGYALCNPTHWVVILYLGEDFDLTTHYFKFFAERKFNALKKELELTEIHLMGEAEEK